MEIIEKYSEQVEIPVKFMKRFLDNIFLIFTVSIKN